MMSVTTTPVPETTPQPNGKAPASPPPDAVLELRGVRAVYGKVEVLHGVDLALPGGEVLAVLGPNGAGKSTMLRVAAGLHAPSGGDVFVAGRKVTGVRPEQLVRRGLCTIPEGRGIFPNLTVRENLRMATHAGVKLAAVEETAYSRFPPLGSRRHQPAGTLSGGEQQMLSMARALSVNPAVLLLDELSMGLAPIIVEQLYVIVRAVAAEGVSILIVEQFAQTVLAVADRAAVMVNGAVVMEGGPEEIRDSLSDAYLGG
jgi:branched-chain amino acid transport system ATP-binding protein